VHFQHFYHKCTSGFFTYYALFQNADSLDYQSFCPSACFLGFWHNSTIICGPSLLGANITLSICKWHWNLSAASFLSLPISSKVGHTATCDGQLRCCSMHHPWPSVAQPPQHASKCKKISLLVWYKFASSCHAVLLAPPTLLSKAGPILSTYKAWRLSGRLHKSSKLAIKDLCPVLALRKKAVYGTTL